LRKSLDYFGSTFLLFITYFFIYALPRGNKDLKTVRNNRGFKTVGTNGGFQIVGSNGGFKESPVSNYFLGVCKNRWYSVIDAESTKGNANRE